MPACIVLVRFLQSSAMDARLAQELAKDRQAGWPWLLISWAWPA
jgi:hypothetical protein